MQRERGTGPVAHVFMMVCGQSALGFPGSGQVGQFKPKERVFVCSAGVLSKGCTRQRAWRRARLSKLSAVAEVISGTDICLWLRGCLLEHALAGGASLSLRPYRPHGQTEWMPKQQFHEAA